MKTLIVTVLLLSSLGYADEIRLRNGQVISNCQIIDTVGADVRIRGTFGMSGVRSVPLASIEKITIAPYDPTLQTLLTGVDNLGTEVKSPEQASPPERAVETGPIVTIAAGARALVYWQEYGMHLETYLNRGPLSLIVRAGYNPDHEDHGTKHEGTPAYAGAIRYSLGQINNSSYVQLSYSVVTIGYSGGLVLSPQPDYGPGVEFGLNWQSASGMTFSLGVGGGLALRNVLPDFWLSCFVGFTLK